MTKSLSPKPAQPSNQQTGGIDWNSLNSVGVCSFEEHRLRLRAIVEGQRKYDPNEPKVWAAPEHADELRRQGKVTSERVENEIRILELVPGTLQAIPGWGKDWEGEQTGQQGD